MYTPRWTRISTHVSKDQPKAIDAQDHADRLAESIDCSTDEPSDLSELQSDDDSQNSVEQQNVVDDCESSSQDQLRKSEEGQSEREIAVGTTVAAMEALQAWLDASGYTPCATTDVADLPCEVGATLMRISCLVKSLTPWPLPTEVVAQQVWQGISSGRRGEAFKSHVASALYRLACA